MQDKEAMIIIVSAPSGSGKTTVINDLLRHMQGIRRSISCTTREPREEEKKGTDYVFVTEQEFKEKIEKDEFLEWEENFGHYYGTLKDQVYNAQEHNEDIILVIDVKGARRVKELFPESVSVFIMPPSEQELTARLKNRKTDEKEQVEIRLEQSQRELACRDEYDYLVVNERVEQAAGELKKIIENERNNRQQNKEGKNNGKNI